MGIAVSVAAVNHVLASSVGVWVAHRVPANVLGWVLGLGFVAFGIWTLVPDTGGETTHEPTWGPLVSTIVVFFLAEMGEGSSP